MKVTLPDGTVVEDVPEGMSVEEVMQVMQGGGYTPGQELEGVTGTRMARSGLSGLTFGFGDELVGAITATAAKITDDRPWPELYTEARDAERSMQAQFSEEEPVASGLAEVGGGLVTGVAGGLKAAGTKLGQKVAKSIPTPYMAPGIGAAEGAVYGAGQAEELEDVGSGAGIGAGLGAAGGAVLGILSKYIGPHAKRAWDKLTRSPTGQGNRVIRDILEEAGLDKNSVKKAMDELGEDAMLADIDPTMAATLAGAHTVPGSGRSMVTRALQERDAKQQQRLWEVAQDIAGNEGNVHASAKSLAAAQRQAAKPMYEDAYAQAVESTPGLEEMLGKPFVQAAYRQGQKLARNDVDRVVDMPPGVGRKSITEKTAERIAKGEEPPLTTEEWDWIQRGLRQKGDMAARAGAKDSARVYRGLRRELLTEVDAGNGAFKQARKVYAGFEGLKEAMEHGGDALNKKMDIEELRELVDDFGPAEMQAFMIGVSKKLRDTIADYSSRRDISQIPLFTNPLIKEKLAVVLGEEGADRLLNEAKKAHAFRRTANTTLAGSATANKQAVQAQLGGGDMAGAAGDALAGMPLATAARTMMRAGRSNQVPPDVARSVAETLTSPSPNLAALSPTGPLGGSSLAMNPLMQGALQGGAPVALGGPLAGPRRR